MIGLSKIPHQEKIFRRFFMIYIAWIFYLLLSMIISFLVRKIIKSFYLKKVLFSLILSFLISVWFSVPGKDFLAPVPSIFFMNIIEIENLNISRILRPFFSFFIIILGIDLIYRKKPKN